MSSTQESSTVADMRGQMFRAKRHMPEAGAREFLRKQMTAHVGTVDANGWPYVVPLVYVYEDGDFLYLHTGSHQGHFLTNVQRDPRICVEVSEIGPFAQRQTFCLRFGTCLFQRDRLWPGPHPLSRSPEEVVVSGSAFG
jgi:hypothetical protein